VPGLTLATFTYLTHPVQQKLILEHTTGKRRKNRIFWVVCRCWTSKNSRATDNQSFEALFKENWGSCFQNWFGEVSTNL